MANILTIEDEENLRFSIVRALTRDGHEVQEADSVPGAWELTRKTEFDAVITDVNLKGEDGIEIVRRLREEGFAGGIIVMTAYATIQNAVAAMKHGADDYLEKPVRLDALSILVEKVLEERRLRNRLRLFERMESVRGEERELVGASDAWRATVALAERLALMPILHRGSDMGATAGGALPTILLVGETGTGKGVLARHIHRVGQARARAPGAPGGGESSTPLVHINCSALPPQLVEAELFGHERGAFTDAKTAREGLFEMAEGGTIFLDEIGDMPLDLQSKILTVVEDGVIRRVGGTKEKAVRARIIAATNQNLEPRVEDGRFRRDLYYRLNAFTVRIPPLRERGQDATLLAEEMLARFAREYGRPAPRLADDARREIQHYPWPGNVRELVNAMQRVAMLCDKPVADAADLGLSRGPARAEAQAEPKVSASGGGPTRLVFDFEHGVHTADEVEKELIIQALEKTRGNVSKAAKLIGMQRSSFRYRIERFGLEPKVQEIAGR